MFDHLPVIQQTLWYIAIPCTIIFILLLISTFIGLGADGVDFDTDADVDVDADVDSDFNVWNMISVKNLFNFLTFFSWSGLTFFEWNFPTFVAIPVAVFFAVVLTIILNVIFIALLKFQADKTTHIDDAVGKNGEVYLTIPKTGIGKVEIILNGAKRIYNATSIDNTIKTGSTILVIDVDKEKSQLIVSKDI